MGFPLLALRCRSLKSRFLYACDLLAFNILLIYSSRFWVGPFVWFDQLRWFVAFDGVTQAQGALA